MPTTQLKAGQPLPPLQYLALLPTFHGTFLCGFCLFIYQFSLFSGWFWVPSFPLASEGFCTSWFTLRRGRTTATVGNQNNTMCMQGSGARCRQVSALCLTTYRYARVGPLMQEWQWADGR